MKTHKYQRRFYRDWVNAKDLYFAQVVYKETDLQILTDKQIDKDFLGRRLRKYRGEIEDYIARDRRFLTALKPLEVELNAPPVVKEMSWAAKKTNVGPMAAVAGALVQFLGRDLLRQGYKDIIIENGGDIFMTTRRIRKVKIYAGRSKLSQKLSLKIKSSDTPLGICTSSGTVGHSLSFGLADAVVILSKRVSLADAAATATANLINKKEDLKKALDFSFSLKGICGVAIVFKNQLICRGNIKLTT